MAEKGGLQWAKDIAGKFRLLGNNCDVKALKALRRAYTDGYNDGFEAAMKAQRFAQTLAGT
jgi:hypothetical protein